MSFDEIFLFVAIFTCGYYNTMLYFLDGLQHKIIYHIFICPNPPQKKTTKFFNDKFVSKYSIFCS